MPRNLVAPALSPQYDPNQQNYFARNHRPHGLPSPPELAQRIEEAKTSAQVLSQVVQSTPPAEVLYNELIKEFVERCQSASISIQNYIHSENPPPDEDTLLTLIETNEQLAAAMSRHQRAMLQARKATGHTSPSPSPNPPPNPNGLFQPPISSPPNGPPRGQPGLPFGPPSDPPPRQQGLPFAAPAGPPPGKQAQRNPESEEQNPFGDHNERADDLPPPLAPNYGLPPSTVGKENDQGAVYRPGSQQPSSYNARPEDSARNGVGRGLDRDDDDDEVRRPVQYRF